MFRRLFEAAFNAGDLFKDAKSVKPAPKSDKPTSELAAIIVADLTSIGKGNIDPIGAIKVWDSNFRTKRSAEVAQINRMNGSDIISLEDAVSSKLKKKVVGTNETFTAKWKVGDRIQTARGAQLPGSPVIVTGIEPPNSEWPQLGPIYRVKFLNNKTGKEYQFPEKSLEQIGDLEEAIEISPKWKYMPKLGNEKGESPVEIISLIAMGLLMIVPFFLIGLPNWGWLFIVIAICVLVWEGWSQWKKGKTISRQFWNWSVKKDETYTGTSMWKKYPNMLKAIGVIISLQLGWFMLLFHLMIKLINVWMGKA